MRITVIGAGYAGLVTAACLADLGHDVTCLDTDADKIEQLRSGVMPIFEPGLDDLVARHLPTGRLGFTTEYAEAVAGREVVFVVVGTPSLGDGTVDLRQVFASLDTLAPLVTEGTTVVVKSTVPVGTTRRVAARLDELRPGADLRVVCNPEFLRQGSAVRDFMTPDRVVVGVDSPETSETMRRVYEPLVEAGVPGLFTSIESAELIKYASNAFLAVKLSFINEVADLCEESGADIEEVATGLGLDPRIGTAFLRAGPGFGGACLPKDTQALWHSSNSFGTSSHVVHAALTVNRDRVRRMISKVEAALARPLGESRIAVLGVTFKANTDDLRESPAVPIVNALAEGGAEVRVYDPQGLDRAREVLSPKVVFAADANAAIDDADCLVVATEWDEFARLDLREVRSRMSDPVIVDLRNVFRPQDAADAGIRYVPVGRRSLG